MIKLPFYPYIISYLFLTEFDFGYEIIIYANGLLIRQGI